MQNIVTMVIVLVIVAVLGALMFTLTAKVVNYSLEQEQKAATDATAVIEELVKRDPVALGDFIEKLGEPDIVSNVTCEQSRCIKARWDISTLFTQCWKRLEVILREEEKKLFYYELVPLREITIKRGNVETEVCGEF